jgi:hypothetical protein
LLFYGFIDLYFKLFSSVFQYVVFLDFFFLGMSFSFRLLA